jgi:transcriptional regulator with XRE-family HTH domain
MKTKGARLLREKLLTQERIAQSLGVSKQAVSAWITGVARPTPERMAQLERDFGVPMQAWTEEDPADDDSEAPSPHDSGEHEGATDVAKEPAA